MLRLLLTASPAGMMREVDVPLGMRHQAKNAASGVADPCDVPLCAVGVERIGNVVSRIIVSCVQETKLASGLERIERGIIAGNELSLAMGHRQVHPLDALQPHTFVS